MQVFTKLFIEIQIDSSTHHVRMDFNFPCGFFSWVRGRLGLPESVCLVATATGAKDRPILLSDVQSHLRQAGGSRGPISGHQIFYYIYSGRLVIYHLDSIVNSHTNRSYLLLK